VPLPIAVLIRDAKADDSVARALLAKRNPVLSRIAPKARRRTAWQRDPCEDRCQFTDRTMP
jgi:hypothetical protein